MLCIKVKNAVGFLLLHFLPKQSVWFRNTSISNKNNPNFVKLTNKIKFLCSEFESGIIKSDTLNNDINKLIK